LRAKPYIGFVAGFRSGMHGAGFAICGDAGSAGGPLLVSDWCTPSEMGQICATHKSAPMVYVPE
jgi:hypothetical protein